MRWSRLLRSCMVARPILSLASLWLGAATATSVGAQPFAYVANLGADTVSVVDLAAATVVATIPAGDDPDGIAISPDGTRAYVANFLSNDVTVIDTATQSAIATIAVDEGPVGLAVSPAGDRLFVANRGSASLSVIDTGALQVVATVAVAAGPNAVAISPDGATAVVANSFTNQPGIVSFVDTVGLTAGSTAVQRNPNRVAVSPDGRWAYVTNFRAWNLTVLDLDRRELFTTVRVSKRPSGVAANPNGSFVYVTTLDGSLYVIDTARFTVHAQLPVGDRPSGIAVTRNGGTGYVANFGEDTVTVVDLAHHQALGTIEVGERPFAIAVNCVGAGCNEPPLTAIPTNTPTETLTPSITPTITLTPTRTPSPTVTTTPVLIGDEPLLRSSTTTVRPGDTALVQITLETKGVAIAAVENHIRLDAPLAIRGGGVGGALDCVRNTVIEKNATRVEGADGCRSSCQRAAARVDAGDNSDPIPNASVLYSCRIDVPHEIEQGSYLFELHDPRAYAPDRAAVEIFARSGHIVVSGSPRPTSTRVRTSTPTAPPTTAPTHTPSAPTPTPTRRDDEALIVGSTVDISPGSSGNVDFHLTTRGHLVAGVQAEIRFDRYVAVAEIDGSPACAVNPEIRKNVTGFAPFPIGCEGFGACEGFKVLILDFNSLHPIPDGARLFSCRFAVAGNAPPGLHVLDISQPIGATPGGGIVPMSAVPGGIRIAGSTYTPTVAARRPQTPPPTSTAISPGARAAGALAAGRGVCAGGARSGAACADDGECGFGACVVAPAICDGGADDGLLCDCPGGSCAADSSCGASFDGSCAGGEMAGDCCQRGNNCAGGLPCVATQRICAGGVSKGLPCIGDRHCTGSSCIESDARCSTGDFAGYACIDDSDCPLGSCGIVVRPTPTITPTSRPPLTRTPTAPTISTSATQATATSTRAATAERSATTTASIAATPSTPTALITRTSSAPTRTATVTATPSVTASAVPPPPATRTVTVAPPMPTPTHTAPPVGTSTRALPTASATAEDDACAIGVRPSTTAAVWWMVPLWIAIAPWLRRRAPAPK